VASPKNAAQSARRRVVDSFVALVVDTSIGVRGLTPNAVSRSQFGHGVDATIIERARIARATPALTELPEVVPFKPGSLRTELVGQSSDPEDPSHQMHPNTLSSVELAFSGTGIYDKGLFGCFGCPG